MIKLHVSGPMFGQPCASPFEIKALLLFKMAKIPMEIQKLDFRKAPKGKTPFIETAAGLLGDSHFIKLYLESEYGADFSGGYGPEKQAMGWAVARMVEEHLYFINAYHRWMPDSNFERGPAKYFEDVPLPFRGLVKSMIRRKVKKALQAQGMGRHTDEERMVLVRGDVDAIESLLGNNSYFLGDKITEYDASIFGALFSASSSYFDGKLGEYIRSRPRIMAYLERIRSDYFPEAKL